MSWAHVLPRRVPRLAIPLQTNKLTPKSACVVPRAVGIVEAMAALVIMDAVMIQGSRQSMRDALQHCG